MILRVKSSVISVACGRSERASTLSWRCILAEFKATAPANDLEPATARVHLPGLDIRIEHQRSAAGDAEQISIHMRAVPSFEAFGRFLEQANPFAFWIQATQFAWAPWLEATRVMTLPWAGTVSLPQAKPGAAPKFKLTKS